MPRARVGELELFYDEEGAGEPVILLMGLGGDHQGWHFVRPELARRHRVVLLDNRDAGASDEARSPYGLADMAMDAVGLMDQRGIERFHVVGASMGGAIAQHMALVAPTRIASLVLASTWARTDGFLTAVLGTWRRLVEILAPEEFLAALSPWAFTHRFIAAPTPEVVA
ncbi:MAG: alpha/beta fold hydrolase, partial [Deltaproteobacteria bacterium]